MVKITFLGTADQIPSLRRNHSAMLMSYNNENILIDCGEGTQRQFRKAKLNPCKVTRILITHWHGDHVLGLPGLLSTLALSGYSKKLHIYGPMGTSKLISDMLKVFSFRCEYEIEVKDVSGKFFEDDDFYLEAKEMEHGINCNAYNFVKKGHIRIDREKLKKSGIKTGPHLKNLLLGKDIKYEGKKFKSKDFIYKDDDLKVSFVMDTKKNAKIVPFVKGANVLISESTYGSELADQAKEHLHLTSVDAGKIAKSAKVGKLVLTHISARYEANMKVILDEAKAEFGGDVVVPKDLDSIEVK